MEKIKFDPIVKIFTMYILKQENEEEKCLQ